MRFPSGQKRRVIAVVTTIVAALVAATFFAPDASATGKKDKTEQERKSSKGKKDTKSDQPADTHKRQNGQGHREHGNGRGYGHHKDHGPKVTPTTVRHEPDSCDHELGCSTPVTKPSKDDKGHGKKPHKHTKDCGHKPPTTTSTVPATTTTVAPTTTTTVAEGTTTTTIPESTTSTTISTTSTYITTTTFPDTPIGTMPGETPQEIEPVSHVDEHPMTGAPIGTLLFLVFVALMAGGGFIVTTRQARKL